MKHSLLLLLLCIPFLSAFPQQIDGELYNLTKMKNGYRSKRISSYDKNGYNGDRIVGIKPNEKENKKQVENISASQRTKA